MYYNFAPKAISFFIWHFDMLCSSRDCLLPVSADGKPCQGHTQAYDLRNKIKKSGIGQDRQALANAQLANTTTMANLRKELYPTKQLRHEAVVRKKEQEAQKAVRKEANKAGEKQTKSDGHQTQAGTWTETKTTSVTTTTKTFTPFAQPAPKHQVSSSDDDSDREEGCLVSTDVLANIDIWLETNTYHSKQKVLAILEEVEVCQGPAEVKKIAKEILRGKFRKLTQYLKEKEVELYLLGMLGNTAQNQVRCRTGIIDVLLPDFVIEVKRYKSWKHAVGQVQMYARCFPGRKPVVYLFDQPLAGSGGGRAISRNEVRQGCADVDVLLWFHGEDCPFSFGSPNAAKRQKRDDEAACTEL